jgi:hypothetical protein
MHQKQHTTTLIRRRTLFTHTHPLVCLAATNYGWTDGDELTRGESWRGRAAMPAVWTRISQGQLI